MPLIVLPDGSDAEQIISARNRLRQYDFLEDSFRVWKDGHGLEIGHRFICELNFYAVQYLSASPGTYRSSVQTNVTVGKYHPPPWQEVDAHMEAFVVRLNSMLGYANPLEIAAYALWRLNWIHPFAQGNGRTSRALSYFVLCQQLKHWFGGQTIPERIRATRIEYCALLSAADSAAKPDGTTDLSPLIEYLTRLFIEQLQSQLPA